MMSFENVKRMMGLYPNVSVIKYKKTMHFDTLQMNAPDVGSDSIFSFGHTVL